MITTLPTSGRFIVDTIDDTYDVDLDARLAVWHDMTREAAGLHTEPVPFMFDTVECVVGDAMLFDAAGAPRVSSLVLGITAAPVEVAA